MAPPLHIAAVLNAILGAASDPSVFQLYVVRDTVTVERTCVLVQREDHNGNSVLNFLTAARPFTTPIVEGGRVTLTDLERARAEEIPLCVVTTYRGHYCPPLSH